MATNANAAHVWERYIDDILWLLAQGKTMVDTAARVGLSLGQTKRFLAKAMRVAGVHNRTALVHLSCLNGRLPLREPRVDAPRRDLAPIELRLLWRLTAGDTYAQAGEHLHLSRETISTYMTRALSARGAVNAPHLVYLSHLDGLLGERAPQPADAHGARKRERVMAARSTGSKRRST